MLHLKTHHSLQLPSLSSHPMQLSTVANDDDDELITAINGDPVQHDDAWTLEETPNTQQLDSFWSGVEKDLEKDPTWFSFDED